MQKLKLKHFLTDKPFSFSRWGDGEWLPVLGYYKTKNADGSDITPTLGYELRRVIYNDLNYYHGMLAITFANCDRKAVNRFLSGNTTTANWYRGDCLLDSMLAGELKPLIEKIREHKVLYVGPKHLRPLNNDFFEYKHYIEIPNSNSYKQRKNVLKKIENVIDNVDFIGYSAGMLSNMLIDDVFKKYPEITQIDFGSSFDGYFGVIKRSYAKQVNWDELLKKNS